MNPHLPNKLIATEYCFLILGGDYQLLFLYFFIFRFFFWLFYVILLLLIFTKIILLLFFYYFFMKIIFISSVPGCSGMFRNVLFSGVFRRPFQNRK